MCGAQQSSRRGKGLSRRDEDMVRSSMEGERTGPGPDRILLLLPQPPVGPGPLGKGA